MMLKREGQLITVIGGGGFVGRYVVERLLADGARVRIAQRNPRRAVFLRPLAELGHAQFVHVDVRDAASVQRATRGSDGVINLAGSFTDMEDVHHRGAAHVAQAVRDQAVPHFVHMSAIGADSQGSSAYARTKGDGEAAIWAATPDAVIVRPSTIFGREDQFINRFAQMIRALPVVPVIEAQAQLQPVYVGDVAEAIVAALDPTHAPATYELGGPQIFTMAELLRWIAEATGRTPRFINVSGSLIAAIPGTPLSKDQVAMLRAGNIVSPTALTLHKLGITPTSLQTLSDDWLVQYRQLGRFSLKTPA